MKSQVKKILDDMGPATTTAGDDDETEGEALTEVDGDKAAGESATEEFFAAGKRGDYAGAFARLKEAVGYCSGE